MTSLCLFAFSDFSKLLHVAMNLNKQDDTNIRLPEEEEYRYHIFKYSQTFGLCKSGRLNVQIKTASWTLKSFFKLDLKKESMTTMSFVVL